MRNIYVNEEAETWATAVNILAVEYLVKTDNHAEYSRRLEQLRKRFTEDENAISELNVLLTLNMHVDNLGTMITQGNYDYQCKMLLKFLDE